MRRVLLVLAALVLAPSIAAGALQTARVAVTDRSPLTVRGSGFRSHERVKITVSVVKLTASATATAAGSFVVRWPAAATPGKAGCSALVVRAVGTRGTVVSAKVPGIECPQGPTDPTQ